ncbi:nuclear mRNA export, poly(A)+RNA binding protein [Linnemannia elongata]|nr:nuclear mRNA export, poly(A)+RNA binding protein [Linnemannia elongata]
MLRGGGGGNHNPNGGGGRGRGAFRGGRGGQHPNNGGGGGGPSNSNHNNNGYGNGNDYGNGNGNPVGINPNFLGAIVNGWPGGAGGNNNISYDYNNNGGNDGGSGRGRGGRGGRGGYNGGGRGGRGGFNGSGRGGGAGGGGREGGGREGEGGGRGGGHVQGLGARTNTNMKYSNNNGRGGGRGSGPGNNFNNNRQGNGQGQRRNGAIVYIRVQNSGQNGVQDVINDPGLSAFLCRRAQPTLVNLTNPMFRNDTVSYHVGDLDQAKALRDLSGIRFNTHKLVITTSAGAALDGQGGDRQDKTQYNNAAIETVRAYLHSCHNDGFLKMERMAADPILLQGRVAPPGQNPGRHDTGALFFKTAAQYFPDASTISLAHNGLSSLQSISSLSQYFPNLRNLSLKGNNISSYEELWHICGDGKLPFLKELILDDNPVRDKEILAHGNDADYRSKVTELIKSITLLDKVNVFRMSFGVNLDNIPLGKVALPVPIRGNYFGEPDTHATVLEFLTSYFGLFDSDERVNLGYVYKPDAVFSCTVALPEESLNRLQQQLNGGQRSQNDTALQRSVWSEYLARSRNFETVKEPSSRETRLFMGNEAIVLQALLNFPKTVHDLSDDSKICVDAWQTRGLLPTETCIFASVHGEFEEYRPGPVPNPARKSFDRTFILTPAPADSFAAQNGWKCVIVSDQLMVREYNGYQAWKPEPGVNVVSGLRVANNQAPSPTALSHPDGLSMEQHAAADELMRVSGLVYQYAVQALMTNGWDLNRAIAAVQASRDTLPPHVWHLG